ncbi:NAD-dependent epimerase/dehydratase family protein [Marinobacter sp.]|uniref:NAD-dependent epimerase/dehydratase family protein n=1 Tax=Marinobacter sp. TaxID=50741 RepID=UPI0019BA5161|nr:NAD-dependent epimerase/dehydratase family protein [Marinobacter sp.]MBD3657104.1 NAD-dependent epimerase/dehydratase family protein [Marinobacter sp.]
MSGRFTECQRELRASPKVWLITGVAGFIGSNLLEWLLDNRQVVIGIDNYATGSAENLADVRDAVGPGCWKNFTFIEGDIRDLQTCRDVVRGVDHVLHHAALDSTTGSIKDPLGCHDVNVKGFLNMMLASRDEGVSSFTYAASSACYGDYQDEAKREDRIGSPMCPSAVTKLVNELYADFFTRNYQFRPIGLRYFSVFGPRQSPREAERNVIPQWIRAMLSGGRVTIQGDGESSRDFCYVGNVIEANVLAALASERAKGSVYNVGVGTGTSFNELFDYLRFELSALTRDYSLSPKYTFYHAGDHHHAEYADISKAQKFLGYGPQFDLRSGLSAVASWFVHENSGI